MPRRTFLISVKVLVDTRAFVIPFAGAGKLGVRPAPAPVQVAGMNGQTSKELPTVVLRRRGCGAFPSRFASHITYVTHLTQVN